ncbi:hypothetical protein ACFQ0B_61760 [Nonomuraea thailandensis]
MATPRLISSFLALVTLTSVGACSSGALSPTGGEPRVTGVAGGNGIVPQAGTGGGQTSAALTPEAYKSELESRHKPMADAITALAGARGVKALDQRVGRAEEELSGAADALSALTPPEAVRAQHETYVTSLRDVATGLGDTSGKVGARDLCTSSAVLADLGDKLNALDQAGKALQSAGDYPADVVSVKAGSGRPGGCATARSSARARSTGAAHWRSTTAAAPTPWSPCSRAAAKCSPCTCARRPSTRSEACATATTRSTSPTAWTGTARTRRSPGTAASSGSRRR